MNPEHLELVNQGAQAIKAWRETHTTERLDLSGAWLVGGEFHDVNFGSADLAGVKLLGAILRGANLSRAIMIDADLSFADLDSADLTGARLGNADLHGADLANADLRVAILRSANLRGVNLSSAILSRADLVDADLNGAILSGANFGGADLSGANLSSADLKGTDLKGAVLNGADLTNAALGETSFTLVDLSDVNGLEKTNVSAPCTIGIDTIYLSKGRIPDSFLVNCGVPDALIRYLPSLVGAQQALQFYSCFISFSFKDEEFCKRLHSRMRDEHLRVWFAPEDMAGGKKVHEQIDDAIRLHDKLLLVLSEASMNSEWVKTETYKARRREAREGNRVLFPIRLVPFEAIRDWESFDADTGKDMAREVREYYIPDFSNWKNHDSFEAEFKKLLRDLKASAE